MKILARVQDPSLQEAVTSAASELSAELIVVLGDNGTAEEQLLDGLRSHPAILLVEADGSDEAEVRDRLRYIEAVGSRAGARTVLAESRDFKAVVE